MTSSETASEHLQTLSDRSSLMREYLSLLEAQKKRLDQNRLARYRPYTRQKDFHNAGAIHRERLFMAGNQLGKTFSGAAECAIHLTGLYPDWWQGRRWNRPVRFWVGSETSEVTRDGAQRLLVGEPKNEEAWGTGLIPKAHLLDTTRRQGVAAALDGVMVKHVSGGTSVLGFKTYDQGRTKWQGETLDGVWFDEECPSDVYFEGLTRTNATNGMVYLTFTPLKGMSDVVHSFISECGLGE